MHLECDVVSHLDVSCSREVFSILVEGDCHHTVSSIEGFFHPITVMDVYVDVQHSLMVSARKGGGRWKILLAENEEQRQWTLGGKLLPHMKHVKDS